MNRLPTPERTCVGASRSTAFIVIIIVLKQTGAVRCSKRPVPLLLPLPLPVHAIYMFRNDRRNDVGVMRSNWCPREEIIRNKVVSHGFLKGQRCRQVQMLKCKSFARYRCLPRDFVAFVLIKARRANGACCRPIECGVGSPA